MAHTNSIAFFEVWALWCDVAFFTMGNINIGKERELQGIWHSVVARWVFLCYLARQYYQYDFYGCCFLWMFCILNIVLLYLTIVCAVGSHCCLIVRMGVSSVVDIGVFFSRGVGGNRFPAYVLCYISAPLFCFRPCIILFSVVLQYVLCYCICCSVL